MSEYDQNRRFMQCFLFKEAMAKSDQSKGVAAPPFGKQVEGEPITLPPFAGALPVAAYADLLDKRRSKRSYEETPMTQEQLSFMLWSTQGIQAIRGEVGTLRVAPSGGARHPFETYVAVKAVEGLASGIYYYAPAENIGEKRCTIKRVADLPSAEKISEMLANQKWAANAPVILFYSCVPYKSEWRYVENSHRVMLIDLGHVGQNAMLSAAALGFGSCCMAAYNQGACDEVLGLDGLNEYTVYAVSVGKPRD